MCSCESVAIANSVSSGFVNALVAEFQNQSSYDFNDLSTHWRYSKTSTTLRPLENPNNTNIKYVNSNWINDRNVAILRAKYISVLFNQCRQHTLRVIDVPDFGIMEGYLADQLRQCDPSKSTYTDSVIEWAQLSEVEPETAYLELKMRHDSIGKVYLRNHAIMQKYLRKINIATTEPQMIELLSSNHIEMLDRSYV